MPLELDSVVGPGDLTVADHFLLTRANKARLDAGGITIPEPEVDEEEFYEAYFDSEVTPGFESGFVTRIYLRDVHKAGKFSSFQFKANFPPGVNFISAIPGSLIENFGFGFQALDGHPKEGLVGGYASSLDAVDGMADRVEDDELFVTLDFDGPFGASFGINLSEFKLSIGAKTLPGRFPNNITPA